MRDVIRTGTRVTNISRRNCDKVVNGAERAKAPFQLQAVNGDGREDLIEARAVIDASGAWHKQNPLGANGIPALGETSLRGRLVYGIPDVLGSERERYADRRVMVVGSGHSAINVLLDLIRLRDERPRTEVIWVMRRGNLRKVYGGGEDDALPARGQLGMRIGMAVDAGALEILAPFAVREVAAMDAGLQLHGETNGEMQGHYADEAIVCTGARPDLSMLRELRLDLDPAVEATRSLAPLIDPHLHSCGYGSTTRRGRAAPTGEGFYIVGMKSYGRAPTFLGATGLRAGSFGAGCGALAAIGSAGAAMYKLKPAADGRLRHGLCR